MTGLSRLISLWRNLFHRAHVERDLDDELHAYVDLLTEEKVRSGMSLAEARRAATIEAGGAEQVKEEVRDVRTGILLETVIRDLRYALRSLKRSPGFAAVAVASLALGLGLVTTMFGLLDAIRHPYVPYRDADRLYEVSWIYHPSLRLESFEVYRAVRDETRSFEFVMPVAVQFETLLTGDGPMEMPVTRVPNGFFGALGVQPTRGRVLTTADGDRDVAVVSYERWRRDYPGRRSLEGATITLGDRVFAVAGVMPRGMRFPFSTGVWIPMSDVTAKTGAGLKNVHALVKLRAGVGADAADSELAALARRLTILYHSDKGPFSLVLGSLRSDPMRIADADIAMLGAALAVLLIACANLANLMLARGLSKRRELALRLAIGASRSAVVGQMFAECAVLTAGGAALGIAFSAGGGNVLSAVMPRDVFWFGLIQPQLSWRVFTLSATAAVGSAVLFGLIPAIQVARAVSLDEPLKDGAGTTGRTRQRYSALVVAEVALALVLLMGAGLMLRVVQRLAAYQFNYAARELLRGDARAPEDRSATPQDRLRFELDVAGALRAVHGVADVAAESDARAPGGAVTAELTGEATRTLSMSTYLAVTPNYLRTMGIPVLVGRDFADGDLGGVGVVIVNALAASHLYPNQQAVGHMVKLGGASSAAPWLPIVGVCRTAYVGEPGEVATISWAAVYVVRAADVGRDLRFFVRSAQDDPRIAIAAQRQINAMGPGLYGGVLPYLYYHDVEVRSRRFLAQEFVTMGAFALILAAVGIYGVLAYAVSRRLREFAVRMALGARRVDMLRLVLRDGLVMALAGTGLGAFAAMWASRLLGGLLEDVGVYPTDALTLASAEALLVAVVITACLAPALRAMRADPIEILRAT